MGTRYLLISACVMVVICMMFCVISISKCCGTDRKTKILARINVTGTFLQCKRVDLGKQFYLPCIQLEFLTELYQTYNMMISIIIICNEKKSRINNQYNRLYCFFFLAILETSTAIAFVHGVTKLPRAPRIGWSFYITICVAVFTLVFFFILLLSSFCCKLLFFYLSLINRRPKC